VHFDGYWKKREKKEAEFAENEKNLLNRPLYG
jgi:hypothetical protein